jgi:anti-sigma B factor antagonist
VKVTYQILESQVIVVKAEGRLDAATVSVFEQALQQILADKYCRLVINMANVSYISSSGLRALLAARRQAQAQGGDVLLCCMSPRVHQIFDMIGFMVVFGVYDDIGQAVDAFAMAAAGTRG